MQPPLGGLVFSVVGPGRVGSSLAHWLVACGARLASVAGRSPEGRASDLATALGGCASHRLELSSRDQDLLLLAVPDPVLREVVGDLAARRQASVVLHCSGAMGSGVLGPLRRRGSAVGSFHPLKAFPRPLPDPSQAQGSLFAVDGDAPARRLAHRLTAAWRAELADVPEEARPLYHLAATLAAGGLVTLISLAKELATAGGASPAVTRGYLELARGALAAIQPDDPADAMTGPVVRGDVELVKREMEAASAVVHPATQRCLILLALESLRQRRAREGLSPDQARLERELEGLLRSVRLA